MSQESRAHDAEKRKVNAYGEATPAESHAAASLRNAARRRA